MNLGRIKKGETKEFTYEIVNKTDKDVKVKLVPYCSSCTTGEVVKNKLKPNESTIAILKFTPSTNGNLSKIVGIEFNNSEVERISFSAEVYD